MVKHGRATMFCDKHASFRYSCYPCHHLNVMACNDTLHSQNSEFFIRHDWQLTLIVLHQHSHFPNIICHCKICRFIHNLLLNVSLGG